MKTLLKICVLPALLWAAICLGSPSTAEAQGFGISIYGNNGGLSYYNGRPSYPGSYGYYGPYVGPTYYGGGFGGGYYGGAYNRYPSSYYGGGYRGGYYGGGYGGHHHHHRCW